MVETYELNSTNKLDAKKVRAIYNNTENAYKLSAGMIKPIINADVSFIGEPVFHSEDDRTNEVLANLRKSNVGFFSASHKVALREGDIYVWVQWDDEARDVRWVAIPEDKLKEIVRDPITNEIIQYVFEWNVDYKDRDLANKQVNIKIYIDKDVVSYRYTGSVPAGYQNEDVVNVLREIPVVQLSNEKEDFEVKGHSEITALEPYLKAYHDVMMMALQAQKNNSAPKLKLKVKSVQSFIDNNWGAGAYQEYKDGTNTSGFSVENLDLVFLQGDDDAEYMTVQSTTGSAQPLLELLFYLIVETSETIEVVFGANLGTSLASVESQLPVYVKKVERKQEQFQVAWEKILGLSLRFLGFANIEDIEDDIKTVWPVVDFESAREKALTLQRQVSAYSNSLKANMLSFEEVHAEAKEIFPNIEKEFEEHIEQVKETAMLTQKFIEDSESQAIELEGERGAFGGEE
ncbi:MAG: hypothetical protein GWN64_07895 [Candidatus Thorarchaeota archaeon]|nr:hypothetical protein [Candidatus Thorarchaeota archaeon]